MKCYLYGGECNKECDCYSCNYVRCYREAIDELIDAIIKSKYARVYACTDLSLEYCDGDDCEECKEHMRNELEEIAEKLKG